MEFPAVWALGNLLKKGTGSSRSRRFPPVLTYPRSACPLFNKLLAHDEWIYRQLPNRESFPSWSSTISRRAAIGGALLAGGLNVIEITFRTPAAEAVSRAHRPAHPRMIVGAGTLLEPHQLRRAKDAERRSASRQGLATRCSSKRGGLICRLSPA